MSDHRGVDWRGLNRAHWDELVPAHVSGGFYDLAGFRRAPDRLSNFEVAEVGDVAGRRLVHPQCHIGLDMISWARRGARVVGVDFSEPATRAARELADQVGVGERARFVTADVYDAVAAVGGERFDIVYTGRGALCWLPDLTRWARVVAELLAPGGFLYLCEFHPVAGMLDPAEGRTVVEDYFEEGPRVTTGPGSYADPDLRTENDTTVEYEHRLGTVITALAAAGLRIEFPHEYDVIPFQRFAALRHTPDGYRPPDGRPRVPLMYSLRASTPTT